MIHDLVLVAVVLLALVSLYWTVRPPRSRTGVGENPPPTTRRPAPPPPPPWVHGARRICDSPSHAPQEEDRPDA